MQVLSACVEKNCERSYSRGPITFEFKFPLQKLVLFRLEIPPCLVPQKYSLESDTLLSFPLKQSRMAACASRPWLVWAEDTAWRVFGDLPDVNYL